MPLPSTPLPTTSSRPLPELFRFDHKAVLVTGGAKGIGLGIAKRFAEAGGSVMIADMDEVAGSAAAQACGGRLVCVDLTRGAGEARRAVHATVEAFGRIDVAVNNAGIFPPRGVLEIDEALWDMVHTVNLKAAFFIAQEAARQMLGAAHGGSIVHIASIDAFHPSGNLTHYDASKGGMVMMTRSMAKELAPRGVRVNGVAPGGVATPGADAIVGAFASLAGTTAEAMNATYVRKIPGGRMGVPDDVATAALFLASDAAAYITGQTLVVDGGLLLA